MWFNIVNALKWFKVHLDSWITFVEAYPCRFFKQLNKYIFGLMMFFYQDCLYYVQLELKILMRSFVQHMLGSEPMNEVRCLFGKGITTRLVRHSVNLSAL